MSPGGWKKKRNTTKSKAMGEFFYSTETRGPVSKGKGLQEKGFAEPD